MANTRNVLSTERNKKFGLRGDMTGATLNFVPTDNGFNVVFYTEDTKQYTITAQRKFRVNGRLSADNALTFGGKAGLFVELTYDTETQAWVSARNNLVNAGSNVVAINGFPGGGLFGQIPVKTGPADYQVAWQTVTFNSDGGTENHNEVVVTPDAVTGEVTLDMSLGAHFRLLLDRAGVAIKNPVNRSNVRPFTLTIVQSPTAAYTLKEWGSDYAFDDGLPPLTLGNLPNAVNLFKFQPSVNPEDNSVMIMTEMVPPKTSLSGFAKVVPIARIGQTYYLRLRAVDGSGAMENAQPGQTVVVIRNGKGGEATGNISHKDGGTFLIAGAPVAINPADDMRPILDLLAVDYGEGPPRGSNRPAFGKAILNFEGDADNSAGMTVEIRDVRLRRGRNDDGDCRGIAQNGKCTMTVRNVEIMDTNNGILTDNNGHMPLNIYDSTFDGNGVGTPNNQAGQGYNSSGYVHNLYTGHNRQVVTVERTSFLNSRTGHNLKLRSAQNYLNRVYSFNATHGRELDFPNGGILEVTDSIFHKPSNAAQNNLIAIGNDFGVTQTPESQGEVIDGTRTRRYRFVRCRFINDVDPGRDTSFLATKDPDVAVEFVDCEFIGAGTLAKNGGAGSDPNYAGMQITNGVYHMPNRLPIWTTTGGPVGPQGTIGRAAMVPMTALPA